jgi:glutathione S-transferase
MEVGSSLLNAIGAFYRASDQAALAAAAADIHERFRRIEAALGGGPYFGGESFGMVDAVFGPVFRYFDVLDDVGGFDFFRDLPGVTSWRAALAGRDSVREAVSPGYRTLLRAFLENRRSALSERMAGMVSG